VKQENGEERSLLGAAERDLAAVVPDGEGAEDAEFQVWNVTPVTRELQAFYRDVAGETVSP
jgi:hypothetical protein